MRFGRHLPNLNDPRPSDAALFFYLSPVSSPYVLAQFFKPLVWLRMNSQSSTVPGRTILGFDHGFDYPLQHCDVAVDADLHETIRQPSCAIAEYASAPADVLKLNNPTSAACCVNYRAPFRAAASSDVSIRG